MDELILQTDENETAMIEQVGKRLMLSDQFAQTMCRASLLPVHLRTAKKNGKMVDLSPEEVRANCVLIVNQALRWGVDPFAILPSTFVIGGKLGFDGKLIAAIVNKLGNLQGPLEYSFTGQGDSLTVTVSGKIGKDTEPRTVQVSVKEAKTDNEIWKKDPEQKLCYTGATRWARRHCPQVILGIVSDVEPLADYSETIEAVNVKPAKSVAEEQRQDVSFSYEVRIDEAETQDEVTRLVDKIRAEPLELLPEDTQERLVVLARGRYAELAESAEETLV